MASTWTQPTMEKIKIKTKYNMTTKQLTPEEYAQRNALGFEGDNFIFQSLKELVDTYKIDYIVETGTYLGATTIRLSDLAPVVTFENNLEYFTKAQKLIHTKPTKNQIEPYFMDSIKGIDVFLGKQNKKYKGLFFLDAHWGNVCPLKDELKTIARYEIKPVIAIHDWKVPNEPTLGYDSYNGQPFTYEWIKKEVEAIYGIDAYSYHYNSDKMSEGAKRGVIYIYPNKAKRAPRKRKENPAK